MNREQFDFRRELVVILINGNDCVNDDNSINIKYIEKVWEIATAIAESEPKDLGNCHSLPKSV
jgi:hypothetical protein